jgi:catecholate siderophore receptor
MAIRQVLLPICLLLAFTARGIELQLNVRNVLDRGYIVAGHGTNANLNLPGAPRNATLTVRYSF